MMTLVVKMLMMVFVSKWSDCKIGVQVVMMMFTTVIRKMPSFFGIRTSFLKF